MGYINGKEGEDRREKSVSLAPSQSCWKMFWCVEMKIIIDGLFETFMFWREVKNPYFLGAPTLDKPIKK